MNRLVEVALILLLSIHLSWQLKAPRCTSNCSYFGEPHLIPFATAPGAVQNQYVCHPSGTETLLANSYINIQVTVSPSGNNPIIAYNLQIAPDSVYSSPCTVTDTIGSSGPTVSCPPGSAPATVTVGVSSVHIIHLTQYIIVNIDKDFTKGTFFDIYITQSFDLIKKSKGVCIKNTCTLEIAGVGRKKRQTNYPDVVSAICQACNDQAQKLSQGPPNPNLSASMQTACEYDIYYTANQAYCQSSINSIVRDGFSQYEDSDNYADYLAKSDSLSTQGFCALVPTINDLIKQLGSFCTGDRDGSQCLQSNDYADQCNA